MAIARCAFYDVEVIGKVPLEASSAVVFDLRCDFTDDEDMQGMQLLFDFEY